MYDLFEIIRSRVLVPGIDVEICRMNTSYDSHNDDSGPLAEKESTLLNSILEPKKFILQISQMGIIASAL